MWEIPTKGKCIIFTIIWYGGYGLASVHGSSLRRNHNQIGSDHKYGPSCINRGKINLYHVHETLWFSAEVIDRLVNAILLAGRVWYEIYVYVHQHGIERNVLSRMFYNLLGIVLWTLKRFVDLFFARFLFFSNYYWLVLQCHWVKVIWHSAFSISVS